MKNIRKSLLWHYQYNVKPFAEMCVYNLFLKFPILLFGKRDKRKLKYDFSLCLIFKNEAPFLKEWIEFHEMLGVDHFYLYNNNSTDNYKEVLTPYMDKGLITLIDFPYQAAQMRAYKDCFDRFKNETRWISFLDADEFICLKYANNIKQWLKAYERTPGVMVRWRNFGTNGLLKHDFSKGVMEQYTSTSQDLYRLGKCFVNTRHELANYNTPYLHHLTKVYYKFLSFRIAIPVLNEHKDFVSPDKYWGKNDKSSLHSTIQINHYFMKAWDLYYERAHKSDVFYKDNPRLKLNYLFDKEESCTCHDYTIQRFFIRFQLHKGNIKL